VTALAWLAAVAACGSAALLVPVSPRLPPANPSRPRPASTDWLRRWRILWALLAGVAAAAFLGGVVGLVAAFAVAAGTNPSGAGAVAAGRTRLMLEFVAATAVEREAIQIVVVTGAASIAASVATPMP